MGLPALGLLLAAALLSTEVGVGEGGGLGSRPPRTLAGAGERLSPLQLCPRPAGRPPGALFPDRFRAGLLPQGRGPVPLRVGQRALRPRPAARLARPPAAALHGRAERRAGVSEPGGVPPGGPTPHPAGAVCGGALAPRSLDRLWLPSPSPPATSPGTTTSRSRACMTSAGIGTWKPSWTWRRSWGCW